MLRTCIGPNQPRNHWIYNNMSFAIYDLDEDVRRLLSADNFLKGISVHDFVEELCKDHRLKGAEVKKLEYLDPKPYIRTFESTLRQLKQLKAEAEEKQASAEQAVEAFELEHSQQVVALSSEVGELVGQFDRLDAEISGISGRIDPLNQALKRVAASRDRSQETIFLIRAYHGFYTKGGYEPLERLGGTGQLDQRMKCARTTNNLVVLARKIDAMTGLAVVKVRQCVLAVEKWVERWERGMVERFEAATEESDYAEMRAVASVLVAFNGGGSVVSAFMNKTEMFVADDAGEDAGYSVLDDEAIWTKLADANFQAHGMLHGDATEVVLDHVRVAIKGQLRVVKLVFEHPVPVLKVMVQRVYAQVVQNKVTALMLYCQAMGPLVRARLLHAVYVLVGEFSKDVKEFFASNEYDDSSELAHTVDQCFDDLFMEYLADGSYFAMEREVLEQAVFAIAREYSRWHERALERRSLDERLREFEDGATGGAAGDNGDTGVNGISAPPHLAKRKRLARFKDFVRLLPERASSDRPESAADAREAAFSITNVQKVIKLAIESVARVLELAPAHTADYALEILEILILDFGGLYVFAALEVAYEEARDLVNCAPDSTDLRLDFLAIFNLAAETLFLLSSCVKKIVLPCAVNNPPVKNRMVSLTNSFVKRCEGGLNAIVAATVDAVTGRLASLLLRQKKKDFVCDTINTSQDYTDVCEAISDLLLALHSLLAAHLDNANLQNVLARVGMVALDLLLDHFKNFTVNSTGGIVLTQDVIRYQSVIDSWGIPDLSESFLVLREISNLFTVLPDLLNSLVSEGHLATLKVYTVRQYILKRADFLPSYLDRFFRRN